MRSLSKIDPTAHCQRLGCCPVNTIALFLPYLSGDLHVHTSDLHAVRWQFNPKEALIKRRHASDVSGYTTTARILSLDTPEF